MMGQQGVGQEQLFYAFSIESHVPADHLLRRIDRVLDLSDLRQHLAPFYSHTGRPSIDPELMIRMLIVGYCFGIRSERRLCDEVHLNLGYRWFCRLGLDRPVPEHSTFSKNRHGRFRDSGAFRWLFDEVLHRCMDAGLVKGEGFAVDASVVAADASGQRSVPGTTSVDWNDERLRTRAVREYLAALDESRAPPKSVSLTDPQASWTCAPGGPAFFAYSTNYLIDVEHGVIVGVDATPANRLHEVESTKRMIERVEADFALKPERLIGDMAYGAAPMLAWLVDDKGIEPHVPVWDKTQRTDGTLSSSDFVWDEQADEYRCPQGEPLRSRLAHVQEPAHPHHACRHHRLPFDPTGIWQLCPLKPRCCPNHRRATTFTPRPEGARRRSQSQACAQHRESRAALNATGSVISRIAQRRARLRD